MGLDLHYKSANSSLTPLPMRTYTHTYTVTELIGRTSDIVEYHGNCYHELHCKWYIRYNESHTSLFIKNFVCFIELSETQIKYSVKTEIKTVRQFKKTQDLAWSLTCAIIIKKEKYRRITQTFLEYVF